MRPAVRSLPWCAARVALLLLAVAAAPLAAQIEEESLDAPELATPTAPAVAPAAVPAQVMEAFLRAEEIFRSPDRPAAVPLLDRVVQQLAPRHEVGALSAAEVDLLAAALSYRAQILHQLGDAAAAEADLRALLAARPGWRLEADRVDGELFALYGDLRRQSVGELELELDPVAAEVLVDGVPVVTGEGPLPLLAGPRTLEVLHPGYAPQALMVEVAAGQSESLRVTLERVSAVIRLRTRPPGAEVLLDGELRGTTAADDQPGRDAALLPAGGADFSRTMVIDGVQPGLHLLEVRKAGFRPYRAELEIREAIDYPMPPIVLEAETGQVVLVDAPPEATLIVDGTVMRPENPGSSRPRLTLPPGEHRITVSAGRSRIFSTRFTLGDRQALEIPVRPQPGLAFLGVLGGDPQVARGLQQSLGVTLERADRWAVLDRAAEARAHFAALGIDAEALRRAASDGAGGPSTIDWPALQARLDRDFPALVHVFAVPTSDLVATTADLWVLPAAPGPARADRLRFSLGSPEELERVRAAFTSTLRLRTPWLGAVVADSAAAPHPVVIDVTPGGPAAAAGVSAGDLVVAAAGVPILAHAGLADRIRAAEAGETIPFGVQSASGTRALELTLGSSPSILGRDTGGMLPALAYTELVLLGERPDAERWLIELNAAVILIANGQWEDAVRLLREVDAPEAPHGVGRATVDYWLGVALSALGPSLRSAAQEALGRAAAVPGARLEHADGAFVAPRAQARLRALVSR